VEDFNSLKGEVLADRDERCAYKENKLRRKLAAEFEDARQARGISIRGLASLIGTSLSQVQRLLHREVGGSITLSTFVRAADALGLTLTMTAKPDPAVRAVSTSILTGTPSAVRHAAYAEAPKQRQLEIGSFEPGKIFRAASPLSDERRRYAATSAEQLTATARAPPTAHKVSELPH
jgi:transcriptional regulator with XRE-family HTH domain